MKFIDQRIDTGSSRERRRIADQNAERDGLLNPDQPTETSHEMDLAGLISEERR